MPTNWVCNKNRQGPSSAENKRPLFTILIVSYDLFLKCSALSYSFNCRISYVSMINLTLASFSKSFVFKMSSIHTKLKSRHFQISPVYRALLKSPFSGQISMDGRPNRIEISCFYAALFSENNINCQQERRSCVYKIAKAIHLK